MGILKCIIKFTETAVVCWERRCLAIPLGVPEELYPFVLEILISVVVPANPIVG